MNHDNIDRSQSRKWTGSVDSSAEALQEVILQQQHIIRESWCTESEEVHQEAVYTNMTQMCSLIDCKATDLFFSLHKYLFFDDQPNLVICAANWSKYYKNLTVSLVLLDLQHPLKSATICLRQKTLFVRSFQSSSFSSSAIFTWCCWVKGEMAAGFKCAEQTVWVPVDWTAYVACDSSSSPNLNYQIRDSKNLTTIKMWPPTRPTSTTTRQGGSDAQLQEANSGVYPVTLPAPLPSPRNQLIRSNNTFFHLLPTREWESDTGCLIE